MDENEKLRLSKSRNVAEAIKEQSIFHDTVTRVLSISSGEIRTQVIPVQVPLAVQGRQSVPGVISYEELDADTDRMDPSRLINLQIPFVIKEVSEDGSILLCSRKIAQQIIKTQMLPVLATGQTFEGFITGISDEGCFVDVDGISGRLRNSDYSTDHSRVDERYNVGDKIMVKCKSISQDDNHRIYWEAEPKYQRTEPFVCDLEPGAFVLGRVLSLKNFDGGVGVFVRAGEKQTLDILCSAPADLEIERNARVVVRVLSVKPGATDYSQPRIRGRILRGAGG